jgi:hypothetical protein
MKTPTLFLTLFAAIAMTACSNLSTRDLEEENTLDGERYGRVVYNPAGLEELVAMRRNDAIERAKKFCGPSKRVNIETEIKRPTKEMRKNPKNSLAVGIQSEIMVIDYKCL